MIIDFAEKLEKKSKAITGTNHCKIKADRDSNRSEHAQSKGKKNRKSRCDEVASQLKLSKIKTVPASAGPTSTRLPGPQARAKQRVRLPLITFLEGEALVSPVPLLPPATMLQQPPITSIQALR